MTLWGQTCCVFMTNIIADKSMCKILCAIDRKHMIAESIGIVTTNRKSTQNATGSVRRP